MSTSNEFSVTLHFRSKDLGKDSTLVLTFDDDKTIPGIYKDIFPTAFKYVCFSVFS
jgi:hypothetical protein